MTTSVELLLPLTGLLVFNAKHGHGSFVTFSLTFNPDSPVEEFYFWIRMCFWRIRDHTGELAHAESDNETIARAVASLNGKKLEVITLQECLSQQGMFHAALLTFDQKLTIRLFQYDERDPKESIFSTRNPAGLWVSYLADGTIRTEQNQA